MRKDGCPHSQATPEAPRVSETSRRRKMRKQSRLTALLATVVLSLSVFAADAFAAAPSAHAATSIQTGSVVVRPAVHRYRRRYRTRYTRYRRRTSRSAVRGAPIPATGDVWARLRACESGGNYATNTGNGFYGAYQFALGTWRGLGYSGLPSENPPQVQDEAAQRLQARSGWGQWPACSRRLGLR
jgi:hypothetical protein